MSDVKLLDPLTFPLHGRRLIEASAGTGKTYTITALYLRLLLGQGQGQGEMIAEGEPLRVDQILVVTFTEAATEELRDRIRNRIQEAGQVFRGSATSDPFLQQLKQSQTDPEKAAKLLELAVRQMDEAAIFTIHGFCQRMLKQHAFESGSLFETELITDDGGLKRQALLDIWRELIYPLAPDLSEAIQQIWPTPDMLMNDLRQMLGRSELKLIPALDYSDLEQQWHKSQQWLNSFCQQWQANDVDLAELIQNSGVNKNSYRKASVPKWLAAISAYAAGEIRQVPETELAKLCQSALADKTPANKDTPCHPLFELCDQYFEQKLPLRELLLTRTRHALEQRFAGLKSDLRQLSFDDLLSQLDAALQSRSGDSLTSAIANQYPVAMIDEFQDTDLLQYRIFTTLYLDCRDRGLFMIGDPKQAIYGFRGADIFTYIKARRQVTDHYTLATNWRSSGAMVESVNRLFQQSGAPFIYDTDIPFIPVVAGGQADKKPFTLYGKPAQAMQFWFDDQPLISKADYLQIMATACASDIDSKLQAGTAGEALLGDEPLQASDLAVLVRNRQEATAVRTALSDRGIASVYLSGRDSVFSSREAFDLNLLLLAVAEPLDERRLRAALASSLLNYPARYLERLSSDEQLWEQLVAEFSDYRECWLKLGLLPMLRRLIQRRQLAESLQQQFQGERRLTDLLHLGEILQRASLEQESITALLRWFSDQLLQPNGESDEQRVRLESDSGLVTVITIHKSKGLEYPLVYLPFACSYFKTKQPLFHDKDDQFCFSLKLKDEDSLALADRERLAEDLRLLYVAVTRSVHACYIGLASIPDGQSRKKSGLYRSALGYLLLDGLDNNDELPARLDALTANDGISVCQPPQSDQQRDLFDLPEPEVVEYSASLFQRKLKRDWRISSYSALVSHHGSAPPLPGLDLEVLDEQDSAPVIAPVENIFSFPKGAQAGTFLHELFEEIEFTDHRTELTPLLEQKCQLAGYDLRWIPVLEQLLDDALKSSLGTSVATDFCLADLAPHQRLVEMEFMLPSKGLSAQSLNKIITEHDPLSAQAGELVFDHLQGMLKGFIDLTFEYQGRYYILDYKSNFLGDEIADYSTDQLALAMIDHRYDLQYQLYTLALHRLLKSRLPDYDYQQHVGGVFYLFLRGMRSDQPGSGVFHCKPELKLVEALDSLFDGEST
ncbi:exodeoxyribonuclease V subunit beta [Amphritea balenae]|uniref:RecBCD enzyme subunit RecB n=2 Tax=Amphritea balenae TaxID=452629 RepID=A0A3P1SIJ4_9GAMM|nr:exodeoxyribonuclease V subunit beta [Amphritea balenae]RRC96844.1 exodeoxyribonuclease V subunit beta [Amphritea balenae]GGK61231.1 RecBCD enzyme subunit RecB [Amphritea balenae]